MREEAKKLLADQKVDVVIGYEEGTLPLVASPCFITDPGDVGRLVYTPFCVQNLATYVTEILLAHHEAQKRLKPEERRKKAVGIVARGCTSRSLAIHLQEKQYQREEIVILGVPCRGYVDARKLRARLEGREIISGTLAGDKISLTTAAGTTEFPWEEVRADNCVTCRFNAPVLHDRLLGETAPPMASDSEYAAVEKFAALPEKERWNYFMKEMDKCIRCYACRNACPSCYCRTCFVEQTRPQWLGLGTDRSDSEVFQIMRLFHMAGRCVDCGSCVAVCPMNVDLRTYLKKLDSDAWRLFGHRAGASPDEPALLGTYREEDRQEFIFEPE